MVDGTPKFDLSEYNPDTGEFDPEFLDQILAHWLKDPRFLRGYRQALTPALFENATHREVSEAILSYFDKFGDRPSKVALNQWLLDRSKNNPTAKKILSDSRTLVTSLFRREVSGRTKLAEAKALEFGRHVGFIDYLYKCLNLLESHAFQPEEAKEYWRQFESLNLNRTDCPQSLFDEADILDRRRYRTQITKNRVRTGWAKLDKALGGGFYPELVVIAAPYQGGKSNFLTDLALQFLLDGLYVYFVNFEDGKRDINIRIEQKMLGVSFDKLQMIPNKTLTKLREMRRKTQGRLDVKEYEPKGATPSQIYNDMLQWSDHVGRAPDVVIVDGGERAEAEKIFHGRDDLTEMGMFLQYRAFVRRTECPWLVTTWSRRETKRAGAFGGQDVKGSIGKMETADVSIMLHQSAEEQKNRIMWATVDKVRKGRSLCSIRFQVSRLTGKLTTARPVIRKVKAVK